MRFKGRGRRPRRGRARHGRGSDVYGHVQRLSSRAPSPIPPLPPSLSPWLENQCTGPERHVPRSSVPSDTYRLRFVSSIRWYSSISCARTPFTPPFSRARWLNTTHGRPSGGGSPRSGRPHIFQHIRVLPPFAEPERGPNTVTKARVDHLGGRSCPPDLRGHPDGWRSGWYCLCPSPLGPVLSSPSRCATRPGLDCRRLPSDGVPSTMLRV